MEVALARDTWLGPVGTDLRGYRTKRWTLKPAGALADCASKSPGGHDVVTAGQAIGSLLHVDFAAQPDLIPRFFDPADARHDPNDPWKAAS